MTDKKKDLYYLDDLSDYKVASDFSDVRGWPVKDADDRTIGKVDGLLASKKAERVVYLDVEVNEELIEDGHKPLEASASEGVHEFINKEGENHVIIPIGMVSLREDDEEVYTDQINRATFAKTNRFSKGTDFDQDYEIEVYRLYLGDPTVIIPVDDRNALYSRDEFDYTKSRQPS
ncbi:PRC-barrel domain-containing protein [Salmonirosea aquatica]|uniref:Photosystem reaction center subunit H n=1 Tax=Salmonirosea aquatica TaxID=2654236 RepID=A0A7C9BQ59_9BACT|nr:photosystem reaction center subunit H [Cytophagaceae bacterium SJW1-29]